MGILIIGGLGNTMTDVEEALEEIFFAVGEEINSEIPDEEDLEYKYHYVYPIYYTIKGDDKDNVAGALYESYVKDGDEKYLGIPELLSRELYEHGFIVTGLCNKKPDYFPHSIKVYDVGELDVIHGEEYECRV